MNSSTLWDARKWQNLLPHFFGVKEIFFAQPVSDILALVLSIILIKREFRLLIDKPSAVSDTGVSLANT